MSTNIGKLVYEDDTFDWLFSDDEDDFVLEVTKPSPPQIDPDKGAQTDQPSQSTVTTQAIKRVKVPCGICNKLFAKPTTLATHIKRFHTQATTNTEPDITESFASDVGQEALELVKRRSEVYNTVTKWILSSPNQLLMLVRLLCSLVPLPNTAAKRISATVDFHNLKSKHEEYGLPCRVFACFVKALYTVVIKRRSLHEVTPDSDGSASTIPIDNDTKSALYYIGGYFVKTMRSRCKSTDVSTLLDTWQGNASPDEWTGLQDRGRLIHISDHFYDLLYMLEYLCSQKLNSTPPQNQNLRDICFHHVLNAKVFDSLWSSQTSHLPVSLMDGLKQNLLWRFCSLRAQAYAKQIDESNQRATVSKPSASLRASLKSKNNPSK